MGIPESRTESFVHNSGAGELSEFGLAGKYIQPLIQHVIVGASSVSIENLW